MKKQKKDNAQKEHKAPWQNQMATPAEVRAFLEDHVFLRHNVITNRVECRLPETDPFGKDWFAGFPKGVWMPISDRIVNTLWEMMSLEKRVRAEDMHRVIGSNLAPDYHPFRYYLDHLPPWDGDDYIMSPRDNPLNYEAIYAQAYTLYRQGFQYWFAQDEIQRLTQYNRHFETPRLEAELVDVFFRKPVGVEPGEFMPVARAKQIVCGSMAHEISDVRLGRAFSELGFTFKRTKFSRGYIVVQRSSEEIRSRMQMLAVTDDG